MSAIDLRLGRWQDALADVDMVDCLICDPPYSARTHSGHDVGTRDANAVAACVGRRKADGSLTTLGRARRNSIDYTAWTAADVEEFVTAWAPRVRGWFVALTDHVLAPHWEAALERTGRYVFAPLQFIAPGSRIRFSGDGPALWSTTIVVGRPTTREFQRWGSLPGGYVCPPGANDQHSESKKGSRVVGGKPLWLMQQLVRDYSRPGDLICDPCAGGSTTLIAAAIEGRRAVGAELDPATYAKAQARIAKGYTVNMWATHEAQATQLPLIGGDK